MTDLEPSLEHIAGTRFALKRLLGEGGMGVVYHAVDRERNVEVALKTLRHRNPQDLYRFKLEFRSLQGIAHPNLVRLGELIEDQGRWLFTMELVRGVDFIRYVRPARLGPGWAFSGLGAGRGQDATPPLVDEARLRSTLYQLTQALCTLHRNGKVHRDIKPSNILVAITGRLVVLDFGLVQEVSSTQLDINDSAIAGTAEYMAPEQAIGGAVGPAADWYSVGVLLYQAYAGYPPFGGHPLDVLYEKQTVVPTPILELATDIPGDLAALCQDLLQIEPERRPDGEEVLHRLARSRAVEDHDGRIPQVWTEPPAPDLFVGRDTELAALHRALSDTSTRGPVLAFVHGRSGIGKSMLIGQFLRELALQEPNALILQGRSYERESVPFKTFDPIIDGLSSFLSELEPGEANSLIPSDIGFLSRVFPVLARVDVIAGARYCNVDSRDPHQQRRRAFSALRELLARIAEKRPLVLVADDLQRGDADSAKLLAGVLAAPEPPRLLFVGLYRSDEAGTSAFLQTLWASLEKPTADAARELDRSDVPASPAKRSSRRSEEGRTAWRSTYVQLGGLQPSEARKLIEHQLSSWGCTEADCNGRSGVEVIRKESAGSPYVIGEFARYAGKMLARGPDACTLLSLENVVIERISELSRESRHLIEAISVAGRPVPRSIALRVTKLTDQAEVVEQTLTTANLLRLVRLGEESALETYHDRIREIVVANLSPRRQKRWHRRLARALSSRPDADVEILFDHFLKAGRPELAAKYARKAADQARCALAFDQAARLYRLLLTIDDSDDSERRELYRQLGDVLVAAGLGKAAAEAYAAAAEGADEPEASHMRRLMATQLLLSGHVERGMQVLHDALIAFGIDSASKPARMSVIRQNWAALRERAFAFEPRRVEDITPLQLARIDLSWATAHGLSAADPAQAMVFVQEHLLRALTLGQPSRVACAIALILCHGGGAWRPGSWTRRAYLDAATEVSRGVGEPYVEAWLDMARGSCHVYEGRLRSAVAELQRAEARFRGDCIGAAREAASAIVFCQDGLAELGESALIAERYPVWQRDANERNDRYLYSALALVRSVYWLIKDQPDVAAAELARVRAQWIRPAFDLISMSFLVAAGYIELYRGGDGALRLVERDGQQFQRSILSTVRVSSARFLSLRGRAALAAIDHCDGDRGLLERAERDAETILASGLPSWQSFGLLIRAGVAWRRGELNSALARLDEVVSAGQGGEENWQLAWVARCRRGQLIGGEHGAGLRRAAEAALREQRLVDPNRWIAFYSPGFPHPDDR
ncbi:MAG: protein kinase [Proteobacteria bacterium]|nr:protein kinase [Pseudomonadota bacterium]